MNAIIIGKLGQQPLRISEPTVSRHHAVVRPLGNNRYEIEDTSTNGTFVEGRKLSRGQRAVVTGSTPIVLGRFRTTVCTLLQIPEERDYTASWARLEQVWNDYAAQKRKIQLQQSRLMNMRVAIMAVPTILSIIITQFIDPSSAVKYLVPFGTALLMLLVVVLFTRTSNRAQESGMIKTEELNADMMVKYVCPKCKTFLGFVPFSVVKKKGGCPKCGCRV